MALAQLLAPGSTIYAVDFDPTALEGIPGQRNGVEIRKIVMDLQSASVRLPSVDGVLTGHLETEDDESVIVGSSYRHMTQLLTFHQKPYPRQTLLSERP